MTKNGSSHAERVEIVERHLVGESLGEIAQAMGVNYYTARKWWRRWQKGGWIALVPKPPGPQPLGGLRHFDPLVKYVGLRLKRKHPGWGPEVILLHMRRCPTLRGKRLPCRSSLAAYLQPYLLRLAPHRNLSTRRPSPPLAPPSSVHVRWQMDFKGSVAINNIGHVAPLNVCDEFSSAPLAGVIFAASTARPSKGLTFRDIQSSLRPIFARWGLPKQLRMDRDPLWIGSSRLEWPGTLLLWLVGLGVMPVINRPGQPTDNAQVERLQRTWLSDVGRGAQADSYAHLQEMSDAAWHDRRHYLPSRNAHCKGLPPAIAFPELLHSGRPYHPAQEADLFDIARVYAYLADWEWQRKVAENGQISIADHNCSISRAHKGQIVKVRIDPTQACFIARDMAGTRLASFTLPVIEADFIMGTGS
jgi:transposase InsO family protein